MSFAPPEILFQTNDITKILKSDITEIDMITISSHNLWSMQLYISQVVFINFQNTLNGYYAYIHRHGAMNKVDILVPDSFSCKYSTV